MQQQHQTPINFSLPTFETSEKKQCGADASRPVVTNSNHKLLQCLSPKRGNLKEICCLFDLTAVLEIKCQTVERQISVVAMAKAGSA